MSEIPSNHPKPDDNVKETIAKYYGVDNVPDLYGFDAMRARVEAKQADEKVDLLKRAEVGAKQDIHTFPDKLQEVVEKLHEQLNSSYLAYSTLATQLNEMKQPQDQLPLTARHELETQLEAKLIDWQQRGVLDYLVEKHEQEDTDFTLVLTPNILATPTEIMALATTFGEDQSFTTYLYQDLYKLYSPEELSGPVTSNQDQSQPNVRFSLIPNRYSSEIAPAPVDQQIDALTQLQTTQPNLYLQVPSVLDTLSYWQTLRAQGNALSDNSAFNLTYIRHFNLEPKNLEGFAVVAGSYVSSDGEPCLNGVDVQAADGARLSVG